MTDLVLISRNINGGGTWCEILCSSMKLVIVSNRLPVSVKKTDGKLEFYPSIGGLATGLASYASSSKNKWVGWPGIASEQLSEKEREQVTNELRKHNCYPVFLTERQVKDFYEGYSNSVLWPLFHDGAIPSEATSQLSKYWHSYKHVNELFSDAVIALSNEGDHVWVHDYQLLLLPELLRHERLKDKIGFFLHIPFPRPEKFLALPHSTELVAGVLGADVVGFHTIDYTQNFLDSVQILGIGIAENKKVILPDRAIRVTDFPMGIDYAKYVTARKSQAVVKEHAKLRAKYGRKKIILTVDRLDPAKGLVGRVEAYKTLLEENPKLHGKVVMVMLVVPSRTEIKEYQDLKKTLEKLIRSINKTYKTFAWKPIDYHFTALPFAKVTALYRVADVAFIAPLRDGMNLVAKEYIASKSRQNGVLVLSKTAGAADQLKDAILVDPADPYTLVEGLKQAVAMPRPELKKRVVAMQEQLADATVQKWAGGFMKTMSLDTAVAKHYTALLNEDRLAVIKSAYESANQRLVLLDYDGTIAPFRDDPTKAAPSKELMKTLQRLAAKPHTTVYIISGRSKADLESWFNGTTLNLVAEHGAFIRKSGAKRWVSTLGSYDPNWKLVVTPLLEKYASRAAGSFVEYKDASLVWHFRKTSPYHAQKYLVHLKRSLKSMSQHLDLSVRQGQKILEIKPTEVHKGGVVPGLLRPEIDFILAMGDDYTDEDMFAVLPDSANTVKVGRGRTMAKFRAKSIKSALAVLNQIA